VREYKKISIDKLQESTKVNPWYLKSLETMDVKNLPATVFVRGYIIQLAKELGLNEKHVADSYMKIYKEKLEQAQ
jgi:cytoskeletal protein RodZ